jgi:hypothetical protein
MKIQHSRPVAAALVGAVVSIATPAAAAKPTARKAEPDLVVSAITINGLGHNPYLLINPDGSYPHFSISVTTRNIGHAEAGASFTRLELQRTPVHTGIATLNLDTPTLAPGHAKTETADVAVPKIPLGEMRLIAWANRPHTLPEPNTANNVRIWGLIPVLARVWDVQTFRSEVVSEGAYDDIDMADPGFQFTFARLDVPSGLFYYAPYGSATTSDLYDPFGCYGIGEAHASHSPWPVGSFLSLNFTLTKYLATVKTSAEPPDIVNITCDGEPGGSAPQHWVDFATDSGGGGPQSMDPRATELDDSGQMGSLVTFKWSWHFTADIPK